MTAMRARMRSSERPSTRPATASRLMCWSRYRSASEKFTRARSRGGAARALAPRLRLRLWHQRRGRLLAHDRRVDDHLRDVVAAGKLVHRVEQHFFEDGPETAGPGAAKQCEIGDRIEGVVGQFELDALHLE